MREPTENAVEVGKRYGAWIVLDLVLNNQGRYAAWCKCDCGYEGRVERHALVKGKSISCRWCCYKRRPQAGSFHHLKTAKFNHYRQAAKRRDIPFELTREQCIEFFEQNCNYCDLPPSNICTTKKTPTEYRYSGIDRVDNSVGYVMGNVVSCCAKCNLMKNNFGLDEFLAHVKRIYDFTNR